MYEDQTIHAQTLVVTLDTLAAAVFVVDTNGVVRHANRSARRLFETMATTSRLGHRLRLPNDRADATLRRALLRIHDGDQGDDRDRVAIPFRCHAGHAFVATAVALEGATGPLAAVSIQATAFAPRASAKVLAQLHALTRREVEVLMACVALGDLAPVTAALGVSHHTLRSHLRAIYQKTGASRQADLVKLVAGVTGPFDAEPRRAVHVVEGGPARKMSAFAAHPVSPDASRAYPFPSRPRHMN